jgi:hypothetical protein
VSRGKGNDQGIRPRDRVYWLRRRCSKTRAIILRPSSHSASIVSGIFSGLVGHEILGWKHHNYDLQSVRYLHCTGGSSGCPTQIEKTATSDLPSDLPPGGALPVAPILRHPALPAARSGRCVIVDRWSLLSRSLRTLRSAWHISYLFAYCQTHAAPFTWANLPNRSGHAHQVNFSYSWTRPAYLYYTLAYHTVV